MTTFPSIAFPLEVDFADGCFWIGDSEGFPCGGAVSEFLSGSNLSQTENLTELRHEFEDLMYELPIAPFSKKIVSTRQKSELRTQEEQFLAWHSITPDDFAADCAVRFAYRKNSTGKLFPVLRMQFSCLHDFLYTDLGFGLQSGNYPQRCQLCGQWSFHLSGEKYLYCDRIAPGETERTCREIGAATHFQQKVQASEIWLIYKRAYKKYYARVLKKTMERADFDSWAKKLAQFRNEALLAYQNADEEQRDKIVSVLRCQVNGW